MIEKKIVWFTFYRVCTISTNYPAWFRPGNRKLLSSYSNTVVIGF